MFPIHSWVYHHMAELSAAVVEGTLEIKCPYSCRNRYFLERLNNESEPELFLQEKNGELSLNVYHAYYFQIQEQLIVQWLYIDEPFSIRKV